MLIDFHTHAFPDSLAPRALTVLSKDIASAPLSDGTADGLIRFTGEEDKRKLYQITELGREVLDTEITRIERLYRNSKGESIHA